MFQVISAASTGQQGKKGKTGQTGPGADVDDALRLTRGWDGLVHDGAVEDVAIPQPRRLTRADQPVADPRVGEDRDEPLGQSQPPAEDGACRHRRGRSLDGVESIVCHALSLLRLGRSRRRPSLVSRETGSVRQAG